nr:zinc ABC transporter substrate-binding protein [Alphaproteobacteria bacterium]
RALPYMVLHDAYQYFEARFYTNAQGAIAIAPDRKPGARRIAALRQRLAQGKVRCLFREAHYPAKMVDTLTHGLDVRVASLDPIGRDIAPGPDAYGKLLRQLSGRLENCLSYSIGP